MNLAQLKTDLVSQIDQLGFSGESFIRRVNFGVTGCWRWTGSKTGSRKYGQYSLFCYGHKGRKKAYKVIYEAVFGPTASGLEIDHVCRNKLCVNPIHLEAVTHRENMLRGVGCIAQNYRKINCVKGHPLSGENLYLRPSDGSRNCRLCARIKNRIRYWKFNKSINPRGPYVKTKPTGPAA